MKSSKHKDLAAKAATQSNYLPQRRKGKNNDSNLAPREQVCFCQMRESFRILAKPQNSD
jgi:hypothetical protein